MAALLTYIGRLYFRGRNGAAVPIEPTAVANR